MINAHFISKCGQYKLRHWQLRNSVVSQCARFNNFEQLCICPKKYAYASKPFLSHSETSYPKVLLSKKIRTSEGIFIIHFEKLIFIIITAQMSEKYMTYSCIW